MKKSLLAVFLLISIPAFSQSWNRDEIISVLKQEIKDSTGAYDELTGIHLFNKELDSMITVLEKSRKDTFALFPYQNFDSVLYHTYSEWRHARKVEIINTRRLSDSTIYNLLKFINNPLYFEWGECGTPTPETKAVFYAGGKEIASITFACNLGQLLFEPNNILARWGNLNDEGFRLPKSLGLFPYRPE